MENFEKLRAGDGIVFRNKRGNKTFGVILGVAPVQREYVVQRVCSDRSRFLCAKCDFVEFGEVKSVWELPLSLEVQFENLAKLTKIKETA